MSLFAVETRGLKVTDLLCFTVGSGIYCQVRHAVRELHNPGKVLQGELFRIRQCLQSVSSRVIVGWPHHHQKLQRNLFQFRQVESFEPDDSVKGIRSRDMDMVVDVDL